MLCPKCGYSLHTGALICIRCGSPVDEAASKAIEDAQAAADDVIHRFDPAEYAAEVVGAPEGEGQAAAQAVAPEAAPEADAPAGDDPWAARSEPKLYLTRTAIPDAEPEAPRSQPMDEPPAPPAEAPAERWSAPSADARPEPPLVADYSGAPSDGSVLGMGIAAIAFGTSFVLSFIGIILGAIGLSKANSFYNRTGTLTPKARTGRILSKVGLWVGVAMTVMFILYLVAIFSAVSYRY